MQLSDIVPAEGVRAAVPAGSRREVLEQVAALAAPLTGLHAQVLLHGLIERERLGSTALGQGCAVPHARLPGLARPVGVFLRLAAPVALDAPDGQPVDLVLGLFTDAAAGADHLLVLQAASGALRDAARREALRAAADDAALHAALVGGPSRGTA